MHDDNRPSIQAAEHLGLEPYKHFLIYSKEL
jgi:hypothetical protein